ncbi:hypothetical protein D3C85_1071120 [compost metagenome]
MPGRPAYLDTLTSRFERLGAPLRSQRWSWGAIHPTNGTVILRVWRDRIERLPGHPGPKCVQLTHLQKYQYNPKNLGYNERIKHVEAIHQGAPCLLILCEAVDTEATTRAIKNFTREYLYRGGMLVQHDQDWWIEVGDEVPLATLLAARV